MGEVLDAGATASTELKNLFVWVKTMAAWASFYRSKHELVFVFKVGSAPHINSFGLGEHGPLSHQRLGLSGRQHPQAGRMDELAHASDGQAGGAGGRRHQGLLERGEIVLDPFGGSGTTLIAAEKTGRRASLIEVRPALLRLDHSAASNGPDRQGRRARRQAASVLRGPRATTLPQVRLHRLRRQRNGGAATGRRFA